MWQHAQKVLLWCPATRLLLTSGLSYWLDWVFFLLLYCVDRNILNGVVWIYIRKCMYLEAIEMQIFLKFKNFVDIISIQSRHQED